VLPPPRKEEADGSFLSALFEYAGEVLAECFGCQTWSGGMTLPSGQYVNHPPQYVPPSPVFPLTQELTAQEAFATTRAASPAPVVCPAALPCPPVMQCNQPSSGTAVQPCAATAPARVPQTIHVCVDDDSRLEICFGGGIRMACKKMDLKMDNTEPMTLGVVDGQVALKGPQVHAKANAVTTDRKETLILEGRVRLHYTKDGQSADVTAECIEVSLRDGTLKIKGAGRINP
jgi:hypothetical protein